VNKGKNIEKKIRNKAINSIENKRKQVRNKAIEIIGGYGNGRIGKWDGVIRGANSKTLNSLNKNLNNRLSLIKKLNKPGVQESFPSLKWQGLKRNVLKFDQKVDEMQKRSEYLPRQKTLTKKREPIPMGSRGNLNVRIMGAKNAITLNALDKEIDELIAKQPKYSKKVPMGNFKTYNNPLAKNNKIPGAKPNPAFTMETLPPAPPKRSFKNVGRQTVTNVKMQGIRNAANIAKKQKAIREAQGAEKVKLARDLAAEQTKRGGSNKTKRAADVMRPVPRPGAEVKRAPRVIKSGSSPLTNEDRRSGISSINKLQKLPQPRRTVYKGQIKRAETKAGLDAIVQRATIESKKQPK